MTLEEKKDEPKKENSAIAEMEIISPICQSNCKVCNAGKQLIQEIHQMRKNGRQGKEIVAHLKENHNFSISEGSLSRHFTKYFRNERILAAEIVNGDKIESATKQAEHIKQVVDLIDIAIEQLRQRTASGNLHFDVSDLDKLMKMRYQILSGENSDSEGVVAFVQELMGGNLKQATIFDIKKQGSIGEQ